MLLVHKWKQLCESLKETIMHSFMWPLCSSHNFAISARRGRSRRGEHRAAGDGHRPHHKLRLKLRAPSCSKQPARRGRPFQCFLGVKIKLLCVWLELPSQDMMAFQWPLEWPMSLLHPVNAMHFKLHRTTAHLVLNFIPGSTLPELFLEWCLLSL